MKITEEKFALWSFQHEIMAGIYDFAPEIEKWEDLPKLTKEAYLDEAKIYIHELPKEVWPEHILIRMAAESN